MQKNKGPLTSLRQEGGGGGGEPEPVSAGIRLEARLTVFTVKQILFDCVDGCAVWLSNRSLLVGAFQRNQPPGGSPFLDLFVQPDFPGRTSAKNGSLILFSNDTLICEAALLPVEFPAFLPERELDGDVAVYGDGQQAEDGALGEDQHEAGDKQASVELGAETGAYGDGEGNGQDAHGDVRHRQRHQEEVGDGLQVAVEAHGPTHQHVAQHGKDGDQQFQDDVDAVVDVHDGTSGGMSDEEGATLTSRTIAAAWLSPLSAATLGTQQVMAEASELLRFFSPQICPLSSLFPGWSPGADRSLTAHMSASLRCRRQRSRTEKEEMLLE